LGALRRAINARMNSSPSVIPPPVVLAETGNSVSVDLPSALSSPA
jgi:hypothetical protein